LQQATWKRSLNTDADEECEFRYQPEGWGRAYRFVAYSRMERSAASDAKWFSAWLSI
jgi:hypothetical protein